MVAAVGGEDVDALQQNPLFDKYVDTDLQVSEQSKSIQKSTSKPEQAKQRPSGTAPAAASDKGQQDQIKTSYYALATGKEPPAQPSSE